MSNLPEVLQITPMATIDNMTIETSILDPTTITKNSVRFVIPRKGILDVGSAIELGCVALDKTLTTDATTLAKKPFYPYKTGIGACIERATLRCGSVVLAQTEQFGRYLTINNQFKTQAERTHRDATYMLTSDGVEPDNDGNGRFQPAGCDWGDDASGSGKRVDSVVLGVQDDELVLVNVGLVKLSQLFPHFAKGLQLPLFAMNDECVLEIEFTQQGDLNENQGAIGIFPESYITGGGTNFGCAVDPRTVRFLSDHLTYHGTGKSGKDRMSEVADMIMSDTGLTVPYDNLSLTTMNIPASTEPNQTVSREIGLAGKVVKTIVMADQSFNANGNPLLSTQLGLYHSKATWLPSSYNLRVNDRLLYNRAVERESYQQNQLAQAMGTDICVANSEYSWDQSVSKESTTLGEYTNSRWTSETVNGFACSTSLADGTFVREGMSHYNAIDLRTDPTNDSGTLVGQKPITLERSIRRVTQTGNANASDTAKKTCFCWSQYQQVVNIKNGRVSVMG